MKGEEIRNLLSETGISAETFALKLELSGMSVRRWVRAAGSHIPARYHALIVRAVCQLVEQDSIDASLPAVRRILDQQDDTSFRVALRQLDVAMPTSKRRSPKEQKQFSATILTTLFQIGSKPEHQTGSTRLNRQTQQFRRIDKQWAGLITPLINVIKARKSNSFSKAIAFGALFYLITIIDLIPDTIPALGLLDDFSILTIAVEHYRASRGL